MQKTGKTERIANKLLPDSCKWIHQKRLQIDQVDEHRSGCFQTWRPCLSDCIIKGLSSVSDEWNCNCHREVFGFKQYQSWRRSIEERNIAVTYSCRSSRKCNNTDEKRFHNALTQWICSIFLTVQNTVCRRRKLHRIRVSSKRATSWLYSYQVGSSACNVRMQRFLKSQGESKVWRRSQRQIENFWCQVWSW